MKTREKQASWLFITADKQKFSPEVLNAADST